MIRIPHIFAATLFATAPFAAQAADLPDQTQAADVAALHCPAEWDRLTDLKPDSLAHVKAFETNHRFSSEMTHATNRYFTAAIVMSEYMGAFIGLSSDETRNKSFFDTAKAQFDLVQCIGLSASERSLVVAMAQTRLAEPAEDIYKKLFGQFDQFKCMGFDKASMQIFRLDPTATSFGADYTKIQNETMQACE